MFTVGWIKHEEQVPNLLLLVKHEEQVPNLLLLVGKPAPASENMRSRFQTCSC
jgi:hypothetical protein